MAETASNQALLTPGEMAKADAMAIAGGIPGIDLMENAGRAIADEVSNRHAHGTRIAVLCGPGNNGGDGFVAARILAGRGYRVRLALLGDADRLAGDAALACQTWAGPVEADGMAVLADAGCVVDALFGAGLQRPIEGKAADWIEAMNAGTAEIVSVDLPSGVNGEDGRVMGKAAKADRTVTFFRRKPGHCLYPGKARCGIVRCVDIGIPDRVLQTIRPQVFENAPILWQECWAPPAPVSHKYRRGHCVAVSGPFASTGAIRLAARASLRAGAGLATIFSPADALAVNAAHSTAVMTRGFKSDQAFSDLLADDRIAALVIGPGLGLTPDKRRLVEIALETKAFLVLDADALTLFSDSPEDLFSRIDHRAPAATVLTPHEGEFARLFPDLGGSAPASKVDRARQAARRTAGVVLLKGPDTIVADPVGRAIIHHVSTPWLATAGSGDVLAGILAGLGAQGLPAFEAAAIAAHIHAAAGAEAGPGLIAEDLVEAIRPVIAALDADHRARSTKTLNHGLAANED